VRRLLCSPYSLVAVVEDRLISKTQDISDRTVYGYEAEQEQSFAVPLKLHRASEGSEQLNVMDLRC
jgi:hypothetical protein